MTDPNIIINTILPTSDIKFTKLENESEVLKNIPRPTSNTDDVFVYEISIENRETNRELLHNAFRLLHIIIFGIDPNGFNGSDEDISESNFIRGTEENFLHRHSQLSIVEDRALMFRINSAKELQRGNINSINLLFNSFMYASFIGGVIIIPITAIIEIELLKDMVIPSSCLIFLGVILLSIRLIIRNVRESSKSNSHNESSIESLESLDSVNLSNNIRDEPTKQQDKTK
jgi:hypothetical protein